MSVSPTAEIRIPQDRPPDWANSWMKWALTTPVIQSMVGQGVALLSFKGRKTGKLYTIPVSYHRQDDTVTIITKRQRKWWYNFESPIDVELRLAGHMFTGKAEIEADDAETLEFVTEYLRTRPIDAKAYGLARDATTKDQVARIIPHIVVIRITITRKEAMPCDVGTPESRGGAISRAWHSRTATKLLLISGIVAVGFYAVGDLVSGLL